MSANLDLARSIYAERERGDFGSAEWADPEMLYEYADGPSPGTWDGIDGMAEGFRDFLGAWKDWGVAADDYLELAEERVLVSFHLTGRGKASGLDIARVHTTGATLFIIGDGRITRVVQYLDRDRALAELGLVAWWRPAKASRVRWGTLRSRTDGLPARASAGRP